MGLVPKKIGKRISLGGIIKIKPYFQRASPKSKQAMNMEASGS